MKTVLLHGKLAAARVALVDDEDYELVSGYRWYAQVQKSPNGTTWGPYARTTVFRDGRNVTIMMHKLITAQCSGWGRDMNLELGDQWDLGENIGVDEGVQEVED